MIKKELVQKNFNKSSNSYDSFAHVQKHMAKKLINFVPKNDNIIKILEIGSGTGIFTEELIKKFPNAEITLLDISNEMLNICKKKFDNRVTYIFGDAENHMFDEKYDLIVSNATFQWFNNLEETINKLKGELIINGEIYFSIFSNGTYSELNDSFAKVSNEFKYSQNFVSVETLEKIGTVVDSENYIEQFKDLISFLKAVKAIGAQSSLKDKRVLTKNILNRVEEQYILNYGGIRVSNIISYVKV